MKILVAPQAHDDLKEAYEYIWKDNPAAAERLSSGSTIKHVAQSNRD